jgi:hypothetical protein
MRIEQLYLTKIIPFLNDFKMCEIYNYELKKFDQELAESMNQKNIYAALDLPDFKHIKEIKLESSIINLTCRKLNLGENINIIKEDGIKFLQINDLKYQLIFFPSGLVPEVDLKLENLIFFMYQPKFKKVYYCGTLKNKKLNKSIINNFYINNCFNDTKRFVNFKSLVQ